MCVVYQHRRNDNNEVFYVGIGKTLRRAYRKDKRNIYWNHIVNKHGYSVEILESDVSWENACEMEIRLIKEYGRIDLQTGLLCNLTNGGEGSYGFKHSEEAKIKIGGYNEDKFAKCVLQFDKENNFIAEYVSAAEATRKTKINHISAVCRGVRKSSGGFIWKYKEIKKNENR